MFQFLIPFTITFKCPNILFYTTYYYRQDRTRFENHEIIKLRYFAN